MSHDKIVTFGMSCSGKTTYARTLSEHHYYCFDQLFDWHLIETLGLSIESNLKEIQQACSIERFVLDGWHLADPEGAYLPSESAVHVIFADYDLIIDQYRVPVKQRNDHFRMFQRWYSIDYTKFPQVTYIENDGEFKVRNEEYFRRFVAAQVAARSEHFSLA